MPLKLKDSQRADLHIAVLLGLGMRSNEEIGRKIGYSGQGVAHRRKGVNAVLIGEIENLVKHELAVDRRRVEEVHAEELKAKLGERAGKVLSNIDDGLEDRYDKARRDKATTTVLSHLLPRGRGKGDEGSAPPPNVMKVSIGAIQVIHSHVREEPITVPDRARLQEPIPATVSLPVKEGETVPR